MNKPVDLLDVVALNADLPERGLVAGLVRGCQGMRLCWFARTAASIEAETTGTPP
jgi:hypothetical protein